MYNSGAAAVKRAQHGRCSAYHWGPGIGEVTTKGPRLPILGRPRVRLLRKLQSPAEESQKIRKLRTQDPQKEPPKQGGSLPTQSPCLPGSSASCHFGRSGIVPLQQSAAHLKTDCAVRDLDVLFFRPEQLGLKVRLVYMPKPSSPPYQLKVQPHFPPHPEAKTCKHHRSLSQRVQILHH